MPQPAREINFDHPVLKVEGLESKFDTGIVSNSLIRLLGSYLEARIVQQLHYWTLNEYGTILKGLRWIYKSIQELLSEVLIGFSSWQVRMAISSLVEKELLFREHLFKEHHGHNFAPKNRTYYYSLNYQKLKECIENYHYAETPENIRFVSDTKQFGESSENPFCDKPQNKTDHTSIEDSSRDQSLPTLPCGGGAKKPLNQRENPIPTPIETVLARPNKKKVNSVGSSGIEKETSSARVDEKINQNISTKQEEKQLNKSSTQPKPKPKVQKTKPGTKPKRKDLAPWKDEGEFKEFYRALIEALPIVANSHSPQGLAQTIIGKLKRGEPHTYWDDFKAGLPIGTSLQQEWEVEPGVPYPMFVEYLTEKIKKGNNSQTDEQARNEVFRLLNQPRQAKAFWGQFKRSLVNVSSEVDRYRALGVSHPHTPVWTRERVEPSKEEAATAGAKIMGVNSTAIAAIEASRQSTNPQLEAGNNPQIEGSPQSASRRQGDEETRRRVETSIPQSPSPPVPQSPETPHPAQSAIDVTTPDPWLDESQTESQTESSSDGDDDSPEMSLREMLTLKLGARNLKGFVKQMPQVSQAEVKASERANRNSKVNISCMTMAEINESLQDPILRRELTPQLWYSDYVFITDELGEIIKVERAPEEE